MTLAPNPMRLDGAASLHRWRTATIGLVGFSLVLRLISGAHVELLPEEAYYWNYSRHLDIGYLDHPPMVAWLIRIGTSVFGNTEFGVRFGAQCCGVVSSFFVFQLARRFGGERSALIALVFSQVLPFFFLAGMLMTPDAPLTAAWAASLYFLERALFGGCSRDWLWAGLSLGLGLVSKYSIGLLGVATLAFMLADPGSRHWFRRWEPYAAVLMAAAVFAPVIIWNAHHDWASFAFQTSRRLAEPARFSLHKLAGAALVLLTPAGLLTAAVVVATSPPTRPWRLLRFAVAVPVTVFAAFSLRHEVKLDWTGAPWVAALPLMAVGLTQSRGTVSNGWRRLRAAWPPTVGSMLLIYGAGLYHLAVGIPGLGYSEHMELMPVAWRDFGRQIDKMADDLQSQYAGRIWVVGMDRYAIASELAFYSRDQTQAIARTSSGHLFGEKGLMYEQWFPNQLAAGRALLLVAWDRERLATTRLAERVDSLEPLREGTLVRDGRVVRRFYCRVVYGYRPTTVK